MQLEIGSILEGKVTGVAKYGAFVQLPGGKTGMVHISEVSNAYVKEISEHLSENDTVKVMVLAISEDGRVSLSIKRCLPPEPAREGRPDRPPGARAPYGGARPQNPDRPHSDRPHSDRPRGGQTWQPKRPPPAESMSFEDMMNRFKQSSNDRMSDLKRGAEPKRSRRGGGGGPPK
jgi:S1 RNA binding domain protein